jgi:hypothetical protein
MGKGREPLLLAVIVLGAPMPWCSRAGGGLGRPARDAEAADR